MDGQVPQAEQKVAPDKYAAFSAAIEQHRAEEDRSAAIAAGEAPKGQAQAQPRIFKWCDVPDYPTFQYYAYLNFPQRLLLDVQSGDAERSEAALKKIIREHNGWKDDEDNPYPPAQDDGFWEAIPTHLAIRVIRSLQTEIRDSPFPQSPRNS